MANQPEVAVYDAGVYQLETTDPVQGGVGGKSNQPLLNLANRTTWLKQQIDALNLAQGGNAPINSPVFTGSPAATTAPLGDNSTRIATTAFVQGTIGYLAKSVAGSGPITLTAVEAGAGIIELTGALTGARTVNVPATPARGWTVRNSTTGAFALTVKTPSGSGVVVPAGTAMGLYSDGTNIVRADTSQLDRAGDAMLGPLALAGDPVSALQAVPKQYADGTGSYAQNGWTRHPSGLIMQWGRVARAVRALSATAAVTFPIAFPTACFVVVPTIDYDNAGLLDMYAGTNTPSLTGVTLLAGQSLFAEGSDSRNFGWQWIALGF